MLGPGSMLFIRHAERGQIPEGSDGDEVPLTPRGRADALDFGRRLKSAMGGAAEGLRAASSPIGRCAETARLIMEGTGAPAAEIRISRYYLTSYLADADLAMTALRDVGYEAALHDFIRSGRFPGFESLGEGSKKLIGRLRKSAGGHPLVCVSHDVVILPFLAHFAPRDIGKLPGGWIGFLEGVLIDPEGGARYFRPGELA